jgi:hypothetical protein
MTETNDQPDDLPPEHPDPPRTPMPDGLRAILERVADPRTPTRGVSHAELAVMAARSASMLRPMTDGEKDDTAQAFAIVAMMADAVDCLRTAVERLRRDQETLAESLITIQNRVHPEALYVRNLPSGHVITVYKHHGGLFAVCIGAKDSGFIDSAFYYATEVAAVTAAVQWSGHGDAPVGWYRHPQSGRRREDGDPARETVRA